ncbi:MAG TPA: hypothetical protein VM364_08055 [Vicinamibacterales bacterium]|nr:hypothetical protein [Vicinamibacterales bacterium]
MAFVHGKRTVVLADEYNLSPYFDSANVGRTRDIATVSPFTAAAKTKLTGLADGKASLSGAGDFAPAAVDDVLNAALTAAAGVLLTIGLAGLAVGARVRLLKTHEASYDISTTVDDAVKVAAEIEPSVDGVLAGVSLHDLEAENASGNGAGVDNGAATSDGWVAHAHCTAASGGAPTLDLKLQDSADGSTWADVAGGAFAQLAAAGRQRLEGAGTLRRHARLVRTIGGSNPSFTFAVAIARR